MAKKYPNYGGLTLRGEIGAPILDKKGEAKAVLAGPIEGHLCLYSH